MEVLDIFVNNSVYGSTPLVVGLIILAVALVMGATVVKNRSLVSSAKVDEKQPSTTPSQQQPRKKLGAVCPFSKETSFEVETAEHLELAPLDLFEQWVDDDANFKDPKPLAARWLAAGLSGQDVPGMLRSGLKRLRNSRHFLVEEPHRMRHELLLKQKALDDPKRHPVVFVAEPSSLEAQRECLELHLSYLPVRYPDLYTYDKEGGGSITVKPLEKTFFIKDWIDTRPLELCERIVQEDLILMRCETSTPKDPSEKPVQTFHMAAAAVVFSFNELSEKLGKPAEFIHAPVPGFEKHLRKSLNLTFSTLKAEKPLWRNNWGLAPSGSLDEPLYGSTEALELRRMVKVTPEDIKATKFIKVEYQTIRRLPRTNTLLFTVKTMADPMSSLETVPLAAACLAASIRGMSPAMRAYKGIENEETNQAVLAYLDSISPK
jgi:dimethylamine monooxygenase subunit A